MVIATERLLGIPVIAYVVVVVALVTAYVIRYTIFGRKLSAVGANDSAAHLVGIGVRRITWSAFVLSGMYCGIGGVLLVIQSGGANPQAGPGYLLPAFAAAFLGATMSRTNTFNVLGTVVAVLFVAVTISGMVLSGMPPWVEQVFQGVVLIVAVTLAAVARRKA